jgi:hypothetical protein
MFFNRKTKGWRMGMIKFAILYFFIPFITAACSVAAQLSLTSIPQTSESQSSPVASILPATTPTGPGTTPSAINTNVGNRSTSTTTLVKISPTPSKTSTPTKKPTRTRIPTRTRVPTNTRVPTKTPTETRIPPTPVPQDAPVRIYIPASHSIINSPFQILAAVIPGAEGNVHMQLTGENGKKLLEKTWRFAYANGRRTTIDEEFSVKISGVSEAARLSIYTLDGFGRIISLTSADILLISIGEPDLAEAQNLMEAFTLRSPYPESNIHHGIVEVRGITKTRTACALYFELVDQSGNIVGSYASPVVLQPSLVYQSISIDLPYQVKGPTLVRLIMHQVDVRNGIDLAVSSEVLKLYP